MADLTGTHGQQIVQIENIGPTEIDAPFNASENRPVQVGGIASIKGLSTVDDNDIQEEWLGCNGQTVIGGVETELSDDRSNYGVAFPTTNNEYRFVPVYPFLYGDGDNVWNRQRGNTRVEAIPSAPRISESEIELTNYNWRGVHVILDVTAKVDTPTITLYIRGRDSTSGKYYTILQSVGISAVGTYVFKVYPNLTAVANQVANDVIPYIWNILVTHADTDEITYSVGVNYIL